MTSDPFAGIPNADDSERHDIHVASGRRCPTCPAPAAPRYAATSTCPACGQNVKWSTVYSPAHWVHLTILATIQCGDIAALDELPAPASV